MGKRIRRLSDLPKWFDIAKYAATESMDAAGWYVQLSIRYHLHFMLKYRDRERPISPGIKEALERTRAAPIIAADDFIALLFCQCVQLQELKTRQPQYTLGVRLSTMWDIYSTESRINKWYRDYARNFFLQFESEWTNFEKNLEFKHQDWFHIPVDALVFPDHNELNIRINTQLPDKLLIDQFAALLKEIREVRAAGKLHKKPDFEAWHRYGVLPYIDLMLWELEEGVSIPYRVMADAIFQSDYGGEEVVRKTTAPTARALLTTGCLDTLASIAAHDIAEKV